MVTTVGAIVVLVALAAAGGQTDTEKVTVSVLAVQATNEGRAARNDDNQASESKPKSSDASSFLRQGFAPGLRDKPKPKNANNGDERYFDPGLEGIRDAVATLEFDTFKKVKSATTAAAFGVESTVQLTDRYTLRMTPIDKDNVGRLRMKVSVDETALRDGKPKSVTALETTSAIAPNKYLVLGGRLPLEEGQLVILVSTK